MHDVIACICCGVCETKVSQFRLSDVKPAKKFSAARDLSDAIIETAKIRARIFWEENQGEQAKFKNGETYVKAYWQDHLLAHEDKALEKTGLI